MTRVSIVPLESTRGDITYSAVSGENQTFGNTAGEALDALTFLLDTNDSTLVIVQHRRPDSFFGREQQARLAFLMTRWREARDQGGFFSNAEQKELDMLITEELRAATVRAASIGVDLEL